MKSIRRRLHTYGGIAAIGLAFIILFLINTVLNGYPVSGGLVLISAATLLAAGLYIREYRRLKAALLIVENQILHIRPVVIDAQESGKEMKASPEECMDVFISCFGILLDSTIIRFNQEGIQLKAVEFGPDFISFTYGTEKHVHSTRLLCARIEKEELTRIMERFRYETGIIPTIVT